MLYTKEVDMEHTQYDFLTKTKVFLRTIQDCATRKMTQLVLRGSHHSETELYSSNYPDLRAQLSLTDDLQGYTLLGKTNTNLLNVRIF
jgi:hypothetical protein